MRLAKEIKPTFLFLENVAAITSRGLETVVREITRIGYDCRWTTLSAAEVGAPHIRNRWWLLAYANSEDLRNEPRRGGGKDREGSDEPRNHGTQVMGVSESQRGQKRAVSAAQSWRQAGSVSDSAGWWSTESDVDGASHGLRPWVDQIEQVRRRMVQRIVDYGTSTQTRSSEVLRTLLGTTTQENVRQAFRGSGLLSAETILQSLLLGIEERDLDATRVQLEGASSPQGKLRGLRAQQQTSGASHRSESSKQRIDQHSNSLQTLSRLLAYDAEEAWAACRWQNAQTNLGGWLSDWESGFARVANGIPLRSHRIKGLGNAVVPQCARQAFKELMGI